MILFRKIKTAVRHLPAYLLPAVPCPVFADGFQRANTVMQKVSTGLHGLAAIPPTLYKNQGEIINLITGEDIDFSNIYTLRLKNDR